MQADIVQVGVSHWLFYDDVTLITGLARDLQ